MEETKQASSGSKPHGKKRIIFHGRIGSLAIAFAILFAPSFFFLFISLATVAGLAERLLGGQAGWQAVFVRAPGREEEKLLGGRAGALPLGKCGLTKKKVAPSYSRVKNTRRVAKSAVVKKKNQI